MLKLKGTQLIPWYIGDTPEFEGKYLVKMKDGHVRELSYTSFGNSKEWLYSRKIEKGDILYFTPYPSGP